MVGGMKRFRTLLMAGALLVVGAPLAASAQMYEGSIPPEILQARDQAKTAAFNDLSPDHRAKVQAIVAQYDSGSIQRDDAVKQIDAVLTPDETKAVLGEQQKMRDAMRQRMANNGEHHFPGSNGGQRRAPDAGRFLLMLSADVNGEARPQPQTVQ